MPQPFDVAIIGAGPGGYTAAVRAGQLGLRTVVVEREASLGGVCLNWGCIPTKALIKNAELVRFLTHRPEDFGISVGEVGFDWAKAVHRSRQVVHRMSRGVAALMKKNGVTVVQGGARFLEPHVLAVEGGDGERIEAAHIIVATGSRARLLPGMRADGHVVLTSRQALVLEQVPSRMLILGAGAVGMEFAYVLAAYGARVTVVEMLEQVLPLEDPEASAVVRRAFERSGIEFRLGSRVEQVEPSGDGVEVVLDRGGEREVLAGDQVLVALGRAPNTEELGLDAAGVATERGFIVTDGHTRTAVPHIYAIGDVAGAPMLAHKASHEGVLAVERIAGLPTHPIDPTLIPSCTYCQPQVASVGLTEERAREQGYEVKVGRFPFQAVGKAVATAEYEGWVKIVTDARHGDILGATIVGPDATENIHELVLARTAEIGADVVARTVHAHPTLAEAIHEAALAAIGLPLNL